MFGRKTALSATAAALVLASQVVASHEGIRLSAYLDPVGIPTICYGSTAGVKLGQTKTLAECDQLLATELQKFEKIVDRYVTVPLPPTRKAALVSFVYNVGEGAFSRSTLLKKLNAGDTVGACNELSKWVYAKGIKFPGLVKRRAEEREMCLKGVRT